MIISNCIVITTINKPSKQILQYSQLKNWDLIIVGDSKTDASYYKNINCIYLGLEEQKEMFSSFYEFVPTKSYTRKMFGYLYAFKHNYNTIYDTDDDNLYKDLTIDWVTNNRNIACTDNGFTNIYKAYTDRDIWPRGIPPKHKSIYKIPILSNELPDLEVSIIQGLVDNDPDVDAYYRLHTRNEPFNFDTKNYDIILNKYAICPFNSQNTFWLDKSVFYTMYLPVTVTFRYTDILRGVITLYQLWSKNKTLKFTGASAIQERNQHDLQKDLESEQSMYDTIESVIDLLTTNKDSSIYDVYSILYDHKVVEKDELQSLHEWMSLVNVFITNK